MVEGVLVKFFFNMYKTCSHYLLGFRMHYGKKASQWRQYSGLGNALLGNLGSWLSCRCYFDIYHLSNHSCRQVHSFLEIALQDVACHTAKNVKEQFKEHEFKVLTPKFPRSYHTKHLWDVLNPLRHHHATIANILVPDATGHVQSSCGVHAKMFRQHKGDLHIIRRVFM